MNSAPAALKKNLFGFTGFGGAYGRGGAYMIAPNGGHAATESVLYSVGAQPADPRPFLSGAESSTFFQVHSGGKLVAISERGGTYGAGTFFELDPPSAPGGA